MKLVKAAIVAFGALGVVTLLWSHTQARWHSDALDVILMFAGFGVPALLAAYAVARPPLASWMATACVAGFGLVIVRTHAWEHLGAARHPPAALMLVAMVGGLAASLVLLLRPER